MKCIKIYENAINKIFKEVDEDERFDEIFMLICLLIYYISCNGKILEQILELINEFDYRKNFGEGE